MTIAGRHRRSRAEREARERLLEARPLLLFGDDPLASARKVLDEARSVVEGLSSSGAVDVEAARLVELFWLQAGRCAEAAMKLRCVEEDFLRSVGAGSKAALDRIVAERLVDECVVRRRGDRRG